MMLPGIKTGTRALYRVIAGALCACAVSAQADSIALVNCNLFDGMQPEIRANVTVLIKGNQVESIHDAGRKAPSGYTPIDCEGNYLAPGMIDVHTHLETLEQARRALESGVTTIRSASVPAFEDVGLKALVQSGQLPGPDVLAAGVYVTPKLEDSILADPRLAPLFNGAQSDEELRLLVQVNADRGVDVIKTRGTERAGRSDTDPRQQVYSRHQLEVIVDEASKHDLPVMVHAHGDEGALAAVQAGARSIEHGTYLSTATLQLMKEKGTWFVPTYITMLEMREEEYDHVQRLRGSHMVARLEQSIREAHQLGVRFATGADNYYDEMSINTISLEVMHLSHFGLSNFEALQAATTSSAELLRLQDKTGRIAEGYEADLILLPANPLEDIMALQDILLVISNGQVALKRIPFAKP
ncbi:MAG TPA: amidohydrolase family protein [Xanthomonadales bacterium]|nr:amidohydrolase family protein [Xanthomonadales bacterium]